MLLHHLSLISFVCWSQFIYPKWSMLHSNCCLDSLPVPRALGALLAHVTLSSLCVDLSVPLPSEVCFSQRATGHTHAPGFNVNISTIFVLWFPFPITLSISIWNGILHWFNCFCPYVVECYRASTSGLHVPLWCSHSELTNPARFCAWFRISLPLHG